RNVISYKIPNPDNKVLVSTWGTHYTKAYCGLGTEDCRAKAFIVTNSLVPSDPIHSLFNQTAGSAVYDSLTLDVGVGLAYSLGSLSPGDSTALTYAYILGIDQLDSAFLATRPKWLYSGDSASLVTGDTASVCKNSTSTVSIVHGGAYNWTWTAYPVGTVISPTTGPTVNVTVGTSPVFVTAIGTSPACFTDTIRMTLNPTRTPPAPPAKITSYCQYAPPTKLTATGINLLWYAADTGGKGSTTAPSPSTTVPGTFYYWVSQTIKGCESDRTKMTVIVNAGNVDSFSYNIHYGCNGDTVLFKNLSTGSIVSSLWDFGDGNTDTAMNPTHVFLAQGTYKVKLTTLNSANCSYNTTQTVVLTHPVKSSFTVSPDTTCEFKPVNFTATSTGKAPLSYLWVYGDGATGTGATSSHSYNNTGIYNAMLVTGDFVPCYDTAYKSVTIDTFATADFSTNLSVLCQGQSIIFNGDYSSIGNIGAIWNFGDGSTLRDEKHPSHAFATPGTYTVSLTAKYRQCPDTIVKKTITVHPIPNVYLGPDTAMCPHASAITLYDHVNAGNAAASWIWNTGETSSSIAAGQPGIYYTTVTVDGCSNTDSVEVRNDCYLSVPNAFTPDGDGVNDYFFPRSLLSSGLTSFKMSIFDRWGELIFQTDNLNGRGWDGRFNNVLQPAGVYIYIIDITLKNGSVQHYQGNITLLR
ncbi:MAG: PKD domain-containing protein, partial [Flavipsychrobacter sp.]